MVAVLCKNAMNKKWLSAIAAGTAFSALQKCIFAYILLRKMFSTAFWQRVHFPKENVQHVKYDAKMHLMPKYILAYILLCKMFSTIEIKM
jgi:hypothetical protein